MCDTLVDTRTAWGLTAAVDADLYETSNTRTKTNLHCEKRLYAIGVEMGTMRAKSPKKKRIQPNIFALKPCFCLLRRYFSGREPHVSGDDPLHNPSRHVVKHAVIGRLAFTGCIDGVGAGHDHQGRSVRTRVPPSQDAGDGSGGGGPCGVQASTRRQSEYSLNSFVSLCAAPTARAMGLV